MAWSITSILDVAPATVPPVAAAHGAPARRGALTAGDGTWPRPGARARRRRIGLRGRWYARSAGLAVALAVAAALCTPSSAAGADPAESVEAFLSSMTRGDVGGALALLDDGAVYEGLFVCAPAPCVGREAIAAALAYEVDDGTTYLLSLAPAGESDRAVAAAGEMRCRSLAPLAPRIVFALRAEVGPDGIAALRMVADGRDPATGRVLTALAVVRDALDEARAIGNDGPITFGGTAPP